MRIMRTFEEFTGSLKEAAIDAGEDSKVVIDDVTLNSGKEIKSTEILGTILSSKTEKEFKEYFYDTYGNGAFTEEDIFTLTKFYTDYQEEISTKEKEDEKEKEGEDGGDDADPLAGL